MNRELLEKPFEPGQIKQRVGTLGELSILLGSRVHILNYYGLPTPYAERK
ncbi:MAG: hypothetical protein WAL98_20815 [Desulfatiglandaceae bacterium]